jgi:hypothetical protein
MRNGLQMERRKSNLVFVVPEDRKVDAREAEAARRLDADRAVIIPMNDLREIARVRKVREDMELDFDIYDW